MRSEPSPSWWDRPLSQGARVAVFACIMAVLALTGGLLLAALTDQWLAWVRWGLETAGIFTVLGLACALVIRWVSRPG
ncbi:hypothetical protein [Streptomyces monomycini]|uniref:hypothetical protein n=1 Tax=Streptomyces monomycini TaxID=371720 RepID=UPI0012FEE940|nr:hypothetical protein [Streptomyces monomycini]